MSLAWVLLNAGYAVYTASGLFKDILRLRLVLLVATLLFMAYGPIAGVWSVLWWNIPVGIVHGWQVWRLIQARRTIGLDAEAEAVHQLLFADLDTVTFARLWSLGESVSMQNETMIRAGESVPDLYLVLDGAALAEVDGVDIPIGRLGFIGEMSTLGVRTASATVRTAPGGLRVHRWEKEALVGLADGDAAIDRSVLRAIGADVAAKLRNAPDQGG